MPVISRLLLKYSNITATYRANVYDIFKRRRGAERGVAAALYTSKLHKYLILF